MALLVIQTNQHRVFDGAGRELAFKLVINGVGVGGLLGAGVIAREVVRIGPAIAVDLAHAHVTVYVAEVLARRPLVIERVLELVPQHALGAAELLDRRVALEEVARDGAAVVREQAALCRHTAIETTFWIVLQIRLQQQVRVGREVDGQRRRDRKALFPHMLELRIHTTREASYAEGHHAVLIHRPGDVERAYRELDFVIRLEQRLFADQRHDAPWRSPPEQNRARPLEHVNALQESRIDLE